MRTLSASAALALMLGSLPAGAQDTGERILMPEAPPEPDVAVDQLGDERSTRSKRGAAASQLSSERGAQAPAQLAPETASAVAPPPLSQREDSRPGPVAPILGNDACDRPLRKRQDDCRNVIEARAAEFEPKTPVSPEQALLASQLVGRAPGTAADRAATQDYRGAGADPASRSDQELASVILGRPGGEAPRDERENKQEAGSDLLAEVLSALKTATEQPAGGSR